MKKGKFYYIVCALMLCVISLALTLFVTMGCPAATFTASAEGSLPEAGTTSADDTQEAPPADEPPEADLPSDGDPGAEEEPAEDGPLVNFTFLGRVGEWLEENVTEVITVVGDVIIFFFCLIQNVRSKKKITAIAKFTENTDRSQGGVVDVVNELIEGFNKQEKKFGENAALEGERYKTIAEMSILLKATLEILVTVYPNSKNIPQGVKDLVNLKYAEALKKIGAEPSPEELGVSSETAEAALTEGQSAVSEG